MMVIPSVAVSKKSAQGIFVVRAIIDFRPVMIQQL